MPDLVGKAPSSGWDLSGFLFPLPDWDRTRKRISCEQQWDQHQPSLIFLFSPPSHPAASFLQDIKGTFIRSVTFFLAFFHSKQLLCQEKNTNFCFKLRVVGAFSGWGWWIANGVAGAPVKGGNGVEMGFLEQLRICRRGERWGRDLSPSQQPLVGAEQGVPTQTSCPGGAGAAFNSGKIILSSF